MRSYSVPLKSGPFSHRKLLALALLLILAMTATIIILSVTLSDGSIDYTGVEGRTAATTLGGLTLLVLLFSTYAIQTSGRLSKANRGLIEALELKSSDLEKANIDTIRALARALETKDVYTSSHGDRTEHYAQILTDRLGLSPYVCERVRYAAILHDIGKIGIIDSILNKTTRLTSEEAAEMRRHPEYGARILEHIDFLKPIAPVVYHHHERYDGKGYPGGLAGESIPIESRIVAVLDTYDALTSHRPYRHSPGKEIAIRVLEEGAGTQFDPGVVATFLSIIRAQTNPEDNRV